MHVMGELKPAPVSSKPVTKASGSKKGWKKTTRVEVKSVEEIQQEEREKRKLSS